MDVVVVDSGMGGLAVAARLYERLRERGAAARIAFVNVRPRPGRRYEDALARPEKLAMLDETFSAIDGALAMDLLAVACNSLSALARETRFQARHGGRMLLISGMGTEELAPEIQQGSAYVFGTELTIESGVHRRALVARGMSEDRIVAQACPGLANSIQDDHRSAATVELVTRYVRQALGQGRPRAPAGVIVFLACSHFGYVQGLFQASFEAAGIVGVRVIDPNATMVSRLEERIAAGAPGTSPGRPRGLSICVHTRHELGRREHASLLELITPLSAATATALAQVETLG